MAQGPYTRIADFGRDLRGFGSSDTVHIRPGKGTFGAASKGRRLSAAERKAIEDRLRKSGALDLPPAVFLAYNGVGVNQDS